MSELPLDAGKLMEYLEQTSNEQEQGYALGYGNEMFGEDANQDDRNKIQKGRSFATGVLTGINDVKRLRLPE